MCLKKELPASIALLATVHKRARLGDVLAFGRSCRSIHWVESLLVSFSNHDDGDLGPSLADLVTGVCNHGEFLSQDRLIVAVRDTAAVDYDICWGPTIRAEETEAIFHHDFEVLDRLLVAALVANKSRPLPELSVHICDDAGNAVSGGLAVLAICPRMRDVNASVHDLPARWGSQRAAVMQEMVDTSGLEIVFLSDVRVEGGCCRIKGLQLRCLDAYSLDSWRMS